MYPQEIMVGAVVNENASTATTAIQLTAATAVAAKWCAHMPILVQRVSFKITTAVNDLTAAVITANMVKLVQNSTPVTTAICTLTIPNGATAGSVYYNTCATPTLVPAGCLLQMTVLQGALGGTPAGAGFLGFYSTLSPENLNNETAFSAMNSVTA